MRGAVAIATAYLVALQLLLTSAIAAQMSVSAPDAAAHFCYGNPAGEADQIDQADTTPIKKANCPICVFASQAPPLLAASFVNIEQDAREAMLPSRAVIFLDVQSQHDPRTSQGPPLNA